MDISQRQDQNWLREDGSPINPLPPKPKGNDPVTEEELNFALHELEVTPSAKAISTKLRQKTVVRLAESLTGDYPQLAERFSGRSLHEMTKLDIVQTLTTYVSWTYKPRSD